MKKIHRNSFIYRIFFQCPLIIEKGGKGGETYLERSVVFKQYLLFLEKISIFFAQSVSYRVIKRGCNYFARYGFRVLGAFFLSFSFYFFLFRFAVEGSLFTLFEFFFYLYLFFLGFFFFILGNRLIGYYETSRLKKYLFSKEL